MPRRTHTLFRLLSLLVLLVPAATVAQQVVFSHPAGFYEQPFSLTLTAPAGYTIRYTLNGSAPTAADSLYSHPLIIDERCYSPSNIYRLRNCPDTIWTERSDVERMVVVRAALFDGAGERRSAVATADYIVSQTLGRSITLPVVSLCVDSADLFDYDSGIFVPGRWFDPENPFYTGNYCQRGREWERQAHFAWLAPSGTTFLQDCGIRIHGARSRSFQQKGFTLYARADYGIKRFGHPFFGTAAPDSFKRLVLRPWMASWSGAGVEDWLCQQMAAPLRCDNLATRPVVLFINGEYWGIYFMEEKSDENYIEDHYDVDDSEVDMLASWGDEVESGSGDDWNAFYSWLETANLRQPDDYSRVVGTVDIDALIDYMLLQVFITNVDWPSNNVRQWRAPGHLWRWIFFDGDAALAVWRTDGDILELLTCDDPAQTYPSSPHSTLLFRRLLDNEEFRLKAVDRFEKIVDRHLGVPHSRRLLDSIVGIVSPEVEFQVERFLFPQSIHDWNKQIDEIGQYLDGRTVSMPRSFAAHIGVDLDVEEASLYPNPSAGAATLLYVTGWGRTMTVGIYDMTGRRVATVTHEAVCGPNRIALPPLPAGVYIIRPLDSSLSVRWIVI